MALIARNQLVAAASATEQRRHWQSLEVLAAARCGEPAADGLFARTLVKVLRDQVVDKPILAGNRQRYVHVDDVVGAVNRVFEARGIPQRADHAQMHDDGSGFLPNPHYAGSLPEDLDLAEQQMLTARCGTRVIGLAEHFGPRARGVHAPGQAGHYFTGRTAILTRLASWLRRQEEQAVRVFQITGGPGTGKSSVLARVIALSDPAIRADIPDTTVVLSTDVPEGAIALAIHAARRTTGEVFGAIAAALDALGSEPGDLVKAMRALDRPFTMVVDALDEAGTGGDGRDCQEITGFLQIAAAQVPHLRLLLGGRPHVFASYPAVGAVVRIDLDQLGSVASGDIASYAAQLLAAPHGPGSETGIAERLIARAAVDIADIAGRNYLVARLIARALAAPGQRLWHTDPSLWPQLLPAAAYTYASPAQSISASFRWALMTQLGQREAGRARAMLVPLAYAQGAGLPLAVVWPAAASACAGRPVSEDDLVQLLAADAAAPYVVEALDAHGRSVYRLYHQALADDLRQQAEGTPGQPAGTADGASPRTRQRLTRAVFGRLRDTVPLTGSGTRDWRHADPYLLDHLSGHAAVSGQVDVLLDDIGYLTHVDPVSLLAVLDLARAPAGRLTAAVYRDCVEHLRDARPETRRWALATSAARFDADELGRRLRPPAVPHRLWPRWSTGMPHPALRNTLAGHVNYVAALACTVIDGRPVVVTGSGDSTARVWDLNTGRQMGLPLIHGDGVHAVACTVIGELPVAVTVDDHKTIRMWDLRRSQQIGRSARIVNTDFVSSIACTTVDGRPAAVTGGGQKGGMQLWNLTRKRLTGLPFKGAPEWISAVICSMLDARPVVLSGDHGGTVSVWDPSSRKLLGTPMPSDMGRAESIACGRLDGRPVAVVLYFDDTGEEPAVGVWDLDSRQQVSGRYHDGKIEAMTCLTFNERLVAVTGGYENGMICLWDLGRNRQMGNPFKGNSLGIIAMAPTVLDDRPAVVTVGHDNVAKVWDLSRRRSIGKPRPAHNGRIHNIACTLLNNQPIAITGSWDDTIQIWDLAAGSQIGLLAKDIDIRGIACVTAPDGRAFAVTNTWQRVTVWDLAHGREVGELRSDGEGSWRSVVAAVWRGKAVAVTSDDRSVKVWDLASREMINILPADHGINQLAYVGQEDGKPIVIGRSDRKIWAWDLEHRQWNTGPVDIGYMGPMAEIAGILVDGQLLAVAIDHVDADDFDSYTGQVTTWDLVTTGGLAEIRRPGATPLMP